MGMEQQKECHPSNQSSFGLCQELPPVFLNPCSASISSHVKVSRNTLPSSLRRDQKPFCCWGIPGCWVCRQDSVLVAVRWHHGQPSVHTRHTCWAIAWRWLSLGDSAKLLSYSGSVLCSAASAELSRVRPCSIAPKVLTRLRLNQANTFQRLHALHLTSCSLRFSLGMTCWIMEKVNYIFASVGIICTCWRLGCVGSPGSPFSSSEMLYIKFHAVLLLIDQV